jgi:hypothetical protein
VFCFLFVVVVVVVLLFFCFLRLRPPTDLGIRDSVITWIDSHIVIELSGNSGGGSGGGGGGRGIDGL